MAGESLPGGGANIVKIDAMTAPPVKKPTETPRKPKELPPYRVLLHNDDHNTIEYVVQCVLRLTTLTPQDAEMRTIEAHERGVSLLLVTHLERAELYVDQFTSAGLTVTMEPA